MCILLKIKIVLAFLSNLPIYLAIDPFAGLKGAGHAARSAQLSHRIGKIIS